MILHIYAGLACDPPVHEFSFYARQVGSAALASALSLLSYICINLQPAMTWYCKEGWK